MDFEFEGSVIEWRGPAPHHFVRVPADIGEVIGQLSARLSYGWGAIPVRAIVGATEFTTSLFPKDGSYLLPLKSAVRTAEAIELADQVKVRLTL